MANDAPNRDWLDVLSDGSIFRHILALFGQVFLASLYAALLAVGFATAIGLSFVLIGLPLLLFCLSATRTLADIDRRLMAAVLDIEPPTTFQDVDLTDANLGERLSLLFGSGVTWRSMVYLLLRLPIGMLAITGLALIAPFLALEMMILAPLGVDMRLLTPRLLRGMANISYHAASWVLPTEGEIRVQPEVRRPRRLTEEKEKRKRPLDPNDDLYVRRRIDDDDLDEDAEDDFTYLGSDGEIRDRRRSR